MNRAASSPRCRRATPRTPASASSRSSTTMCSAISSKSPRSTARQLMSAPLNATFIHRQTLAGQVRFTTTELGELEAKIASAAERALGIELEIFERLTARVIAAERQHQGLPPRRWPRSMSQRACTARHRARLRASAGRSTVTRLRRRRRPPSGGRAGTVARRHAVRRQ